MQPFKKTSDTVTGSRIPAVDYAKTLAIIWLALCYIKQSGKQIATKENT